MAIKPILKDIYIATTSDAQGDGIRFDFSYTGGAIGKYKFCISQVVSGTETVLLTKELATTNYYYLFKDTDSILTAGNQYYAYITVYTKDPSDSSKWIASEVSNKIIFKYITTPSFYMSINNTELTNGTSLTTPGSIVEITYSQSEGEALNEYEFILYDNEKHEIKNTGVLYNTGTDMTFILSGLSAEASYYLRAMGKTANGLSLDTGYISLTTAYTVSTLFSNLTLTNHPDKGYVRVSSSLKLIEGICDGEEIYINNEKLDLLNYDSKVVFDGGFAVPNEFNLHLKGNFDNTGEIISIGENGEIKVFYMADEIGIADSNTTTVYNDGSSSSNTLGYFTIVENNILPVYVKSNYLIPKPSPTTNVELWIQRKNNTYSIIAWT